MTCSNVSTASESGPMLSVVDFHIAGLIDTVLGAAPKRLEPFLRALWSSNERLAARVVVPPERVWRVLYGTGRVG